MMTQDNAMEHLNACAIPLGNISALGNSLPADQYSSGAFYCHFEQGLHCNNHDAGIGE